MTTFTLAWMASTTLGAVLGVAIFGPGIISFAFCVIICLVSYIILTLGLIK